MNDMNEASVSMNPESPMDSTPEDGEMGMKKILTALFALGVIVLAGYALWSGNTPSQEPTEITPVPEEYGRSAVDNFVGNITRITDPVESDIRVLLVETSIPDRSKPIDAYGKTEMQDRAFTVIVDGNTELTGTTKDGISAGSTVFVRTNRDIYGVDKEDDPIIATELEDLTAVEG